MHPEDLHTQEEWHGLLLAAQKDPGVVTPFQLACNHLRGEPPQLPDSGHARRSTGDAREMVWMWKRGPGFEADIPGSDHPAPLARLLSVNILCMNLSGKSIS